MSVRTTCSRIIGVFFMTVAGRVGAADLPQQSAPPRIAETQLTLRLASVQGRATVVAIADRTLTVITAAHFLSTKDVGKPILIQQAEGRHFGHVESVAWNPRFQPIRSRNSPGMSTSGTLGVDTAIATLKVTLQDEGERPVFEKIKAADLTAHRIPSTQGQILPIHIVDQSGKEHLLRAGNHLNPKCLAWGSQNYEARPGDSGAGVFIIKKTPEGEPWPILIGNVSQTDDRGAIASLTYRDDPWIASALAPPPSPSK